MSQNVIIVGAGIGGLTAAAVLLDRGHRVRVYEQAPALGEIGAGVYITPNAVRQFERVGWVGFGPGWRIAGRRRQRLVDLQPTIVRLIRQRAKNIGWRRGRQMLLFSWVAHCSCTVLIVRSNSALASSKAFSGALSEM